MIKYELKEEYRFEEIWNFSNSKQKFEIQALLQGDTIYLVSLEKNSE